MLLIVPNITQKLRERGGGGNVLQTGIWYMSTQNTIFDMAGWVVIT